MNPVNQFILGSNPYLDDLDTQIAKSKEYQQRLMQLKQNEGTPLWDKIDSEINTLTPVQQNKMLQNKEYAEVNTKLQGLVWSELVKLVKSKIETNNKELLSKQLELISKLKAKIVEEDTRELDLFNEFKEYIEELLKNNGKIVVTKQAGLLKCYK